MVEKVVAKLNKNLRLQEEERNKEEINPTQESLNKITLSSLAQADVEDQEKKMEDARQKQEKEQAEKKQNEETNKLAQQALEEAKMSTKAVFDGSLIASATAVAKDPLPAGLTPSLMSIDKPKLSNEHTMDMIDDIFNDMHPTAKKVSDMQKMKEAAKAKLTAKLNHHA